jgi:hypothetical protein
MKPKILRPIRVPSVLIRGLCLLISSFLIHPSSLLAADNTAVMVKPPVSGLRDIYEDINFPTAHPLYSEGAAIHFGNSANKIPILDSGGHFVLSILPVTGLPSLAFGTTGSLSTATPLNLDLGGTFSNLAGAHPKLILFDSGTTASQYGLGVSSNEMDFMVPTGASYFWNVNGIAKMSLDNTGKLTLANGITGSNTPPFATLSGAEAEINKIENGMTLGVGTGTGMSDSPSFTMTPAAAFNFNLVKVGWSGAGGLTARTTGATNVMFPTSGQLATVGCGAGCVKGTSDDTITSASTIVLDGKLGTQADVTGTTTITAVTLASGSEYTVRFTGILILTNGASLILPGGVNKKTANGDYAVFRGGASGVVKCTAYINAASGASVANIDGGVILNLSSLSFANDTTAFSEGITFPDSAPSANRALVTILNNNSRTFNLGGDLTFANSFTTSGAFPITLVATAASIPTLPAGTHSLAPLDGPTFTGVPAAPTAAVDNNTNQLADTAFVLAQAASATPLVNGTGAPGTSTRYARGDHVHPPDTTRLATGGLPIATMGIKASDANAFLPIILYVKSVTVLTTGAPADIATISIPAGITRFRVTGASKDSVFFSETASGTLGGANFALWDAAGGTGVNLEAAAAGPAAVSTVAFWSSVSPGNFSTSGTIYIRQTANSANAGTLSFYIEIIPMP